MSTPVGLSPFLRLAIVATVVALASPAARAQTGCQPSWAPTFGAPGPIGVNGEVLAFMSFDDGNGPALFAGGAFTTAGGVAANHIAKWNGSSWSALGAGTDGNVLSLCVFDDGTGDALYAGGSFSTAGGVAAARIAKWNGASWSALGGGVTSVGGAVRALAVYEDAGGPALVAGGDFFSVSGVAANNLAKWNGAGWSALGSGTDTIVSALRVFKLGGNKLYAGGVFTTAGGVAANGIATWDGSSWSPVGSGVGGALIPQVLAFEVFNDGSGPALYAGGWFTTMNGVAANQIARWNGSSWSAVGAGMGGGGGFAYVHDLEIFDDGGGLALYAGGAFTTSGGVTTNHVARWKSSAWSALGSGVNAPVRALAGFDPGSGPTLYAGGEFTAVGDVAASHVAKFKSSKWSAIANGLDDGVYAVTVFDDGNGPALYAGGAFTTAGDTTAHGIAKWNGAGWSPLGSGVDGFGYVLALAALDDGSGPALYAGGYFTSMGGVPASHIAKWNGTSWSALGSGVDDTVWSLAAFDDGSGPALFVGGWIMTAGGLSTPGLAKWNGSTWSAIPGALNGPFMPNIYALVVFDDGSGPALFVGGEYATAGALTVNGIAKWNGASWSALAGGVSGGISQVEALAVFDDGTGPALVAGGFFSGAGGVTANSVAKWNGASWSALGNGITSGPSPGFVDDLIAFDDGSGPSLVAAGLFATAGGAPASNLATWNGAAWSPVGAGTNGEVDALAVFDDGGGKALYASGSFVVSPAGDSYLATWRSCPPGLPSGLSTFGTGTVGCQGTETCSANSSPIVGNAGFQLTCDHAPPSSAGLGMIANAQDSAGHDTFGVGILIHLDLFSAPQVYVLDFVSNAAGHGFAAAPIPNNPSFVGQKLYGQAVWYWAGACALPSPFSLSSSRGVAITFLP